MSMLKFRPTRTERDEPIERHEPIPYAPRPKPAPPGPHQLGNITLQALDQITEKCAQEYDRAADQLEEAARERADGLRECAKRMRNTGLLAQEKVANFVKVMVTCSDVSLATQGAVARCDEVKPEPQPAPTVEVPNHPFISESSAADFIGTTEQPANLDAIEKAVAEVISEPGAAP